MQVLIIVYCYRAAALIESRDPPRSLNLVIRLAPRARAAGACSIVIRRALVIRRAIGTRAPALALRRVQLL